MVHLLNEMVMILDRHMNFHVNHIGVLNQHPLLTTKNRYSLRQSSALRASPWMEIRADREEVWDNFGQADKPMGTAIN